LNDGAAGLADLKRCGGTTIVQNPAEAAESEMPLAALAATDIDYRAPLAELGSLLAMLTSRSSSPSPPPPEDVRLEVEIALGRPTGPEATERLAAPVPLSCPACGGVLSEVTRAPPLRFRCQVGHAYTGEALDHEQESSVDEALRVALRIVEERALLTTKMAEEARSRGRRLSALSYERSAAESQNSVDTLRGALRRIQRDPKALSSGG
jgi:two-component system chemotaxis response regulator CheB